MRKCPTCGQEVADPTRVRVSLDENTLSFGGNVVQLYPKQAEVAAVLAEQIGHTVTRDNILRRVWGVTETDNSDRSLDQHIMQLRRKIRPIGLKVINTWGRGYRLDHA